MSRPSIIAGLGNPGRRYAGTRHDLGFALVARLADSAGESFRCVGDVDLAGPIRLTADGPEVLLARPLRYMNRSGPPLRRLIEAVGATPAELLVACDDVNLDLGRLRLRPSGSAGGHNGLRSIIAELGPDFARLRMGVGGPPEGEELADWVLDGFDESELDAVRDMLERATETTRAVLEFGIVGAMSRMPSVPRSENREDSDD